MVRVASGWMDVQGRKAEISLALGKTLGFPPSTLIPPPAWADRALHPPVLLPHSPALCTHTAPGFQKENTLLYLHRENWELLPARWFAPLSMADGPGSSHPWHRSRRAWGQSTTTDLLRHPWAAINEGRSSCPCPNRCSPAPEHSCTAGCLKGDGFCFTEVGSR